MLISKRAISGVELVADGQSPGTEFIINAASGSWWADLEEEHSGEVIGVIVRVTTLGSTGAAATGTLDTLRVKLASLRGHSPTAASDVRAENLIFDSGSLATPTPSATASAEVGLFGGATGDPQPFSGGFRVLADWGASGGAYNRVVKIAVLYRVNGVG